MKTIDINSRNRNQIDNSSSVHPNAKIGKNVSIGPYSIIGEDVTIGDNCIIGPQVIIKGYTVIGTGNKFYAGSTIGCEPQEPSLTGEKTFLYIGNNNLFREKVIISVGTMEGGLETRIGNNNLFMNYSHIAHDCQIGDNVVITNSVSMGGNVIIEDKVKIGGSSGIRPFCRIGKMAMVGAMTKINRDVPPFMLVDGDPLEVYGLNIVGLRRNEVNPKNRMLLKRAFRILYHSNLKIDAAIEQIKQEVEGVMEIEDLISFLKDSKIGIIGFK